MSQRLTGTINDGVLKFDEPPADLPNHSRVVVILEPLTEVEQRLAAWDSIEKRLRERPINAQGLRFTRDELHERH